ncbi:acyl-CoA thioesterase [Rarobacter incanus]|uniref:Acyl-CoA thioester hydrolase n=1 Tax=Rarobacter incanus TaxID=153494 RepID=A0A542SSZ1_9MICO|nr:thioesterase family protein [Rarobacter incanus]TQK77387.1 acyl-CoA thioester hydrolase [Rarobacter incanus]
MPTVTVEIPIRWGDLDPYGHVNNVAMFSLLEEARIAVFWHGKAGSPVRIGAGVAGDTATLVAAHHIEYLRPLLHSDKPASVTLWVSKIGGASFDIDYLVSDGEQICTRARTTLVLADPATNKPRRMTKDEQRELRRLSDEPLQFRR